MFLAFLGGSSGCEFSRFFASDNSGSNYLRVTHKKAPKNRAGGRFPSYPQRRWPEEGGGLVRARDVDRQERPLGRRRLTRGR